MPQGAEDTKSREANLRRLQLAMVAELKKRGYKPGSKEFAAEKKRLDNALVNYVYNSGKADVPIPKPKPAPKAAPAPAPKPTPSGSSPFLNTPKGPRQMTPPSSRTSQKSTSGKSSSSTGAIVGGAVVAGAAGTAATIAARKRAAVAKNNRIQALNEQYDRNDAARAKRIGGQSPAASRVSADRAEAISRTKPQPAPKKGAPTPAKATPKPSTPTKKSPTPKATPKPKPSTSVTKKAAPKAPSVKPKPTPKSPTPPKKAGSSATPPSPKAAPKPPKGPTSKSPGTRKAGPSADRRAGLNLPEKDGGYIIVERRPARPGSRSGGSSRRTGSVGIPRGAAPISTRSQVIAGRPLIRGQQTGGLRGLTATEMFHLGGMQTGIGAQQSTGYFPRRGTGGAVSGAAYPYFKRAK